MTQPLATRRSLWELDPFPSEMARFESWQSATASLADALRPLVQPNTWISPVDAESAGLAQGVGALLGCPVGFTERPVTTLWVQATLSSSALAPWGAGPCVTAPRCVGALVGSQALVEAMRSEFQELRVLRTPYRVGQLERWFRSAYARPLEPNARAS